MSIYTIKSRKLQNTSYFNEISSQLNFVTGIGRDTQLDVVLWLLKIFGSCPLSSLGTTQRYYILKWTSLSTILSLCSAAYFVFTYIIFITHVTFKKYFLFEESIRHTFTNFENAMKADSVLSKATSLSTLQGMQGWNFFMPLHSLISIFLSWQSSLKLAEYLNNWVSIEKQFSSTFPTEAVIGSKSSVKGQTSTGLRLYGAVACAIPFVWGITLLVVDSDCPINQLWLMFTVLAQYCITEMLDDAKVMLMCTSLTGAFEKIRACIKQSEERRLPNAFTVQSWRQILKQIQNQCELAGYCLMPTQLAFLFHILICGTICLYVTLNGFGNSPLSNAMALFTGLFFFLWMGRLYFKVLVAEKITEAEAAIAKDLIQMESAQFGIEVISQIRLTYDALVQNPSRLNLGNYVYLNKRLFLGIVGQMLTYLIVLMQFYPVNLPTI